MQSRSPLSSYNVLDAAAEIAAREITYQLHVSAEAYKAAKRLIRNRRTNGATTKELDAAYALTSGFLSDTNHETLCKLHMGINRARVKKEA